MTSTRRCMTCGSLRRNGLLPELRCGMCRHHRACIFCGLEERTHAVGCNALLRPMTEEDWQQRRATLRLAGRHFDLDPRQRLFPAKLVPLREVNAVPTEDTWCMLEQIICSAWEAES